MKQKKTAIMLFASALLLALALPVLPSLLNSGDFYGMAIDQPGEAISGYRPPPDGLAVIFFGYRHCGTVCPVQLVNLLELSHRLENANVDFMFVTLDPENDTPEELRQTMAQMGDAFRFYRPESFQAAQRLASVYNDFAVKQSEWSDEPIAHSARLHVVTPDFRRRLVYTTPELNLDLVERDLRRLMEEGNRESSI